MRLLPKGTSTPARTKTTNFLLGHFTIVAIIGGTFALSSGTEGGLGRNQQGVLTGVIAVLGIGAVYWIRHHWKVERAAMCQLTEYYKALGKKNVFRWDFANIAGVIALAVAAILAAWLHP